MVKNIQGGLAAMMQSPFMQSQQEQPLPQDQFGGIKQSIQTAQNPSALQAQLAPTGPVLSKDDLWRYQQMEKALGQDQRMKNTMGQTFTGEEGIGGGFLQAYRPTGDIYNKFTGDLDYLKNAGIAQKSTGGGDVDALTRELTEMANRGMQFGNTAMKNPGQISRMAPDLARYGVRSLSDLQAVNVPGYGTLYYNKGNNTILPADFGSSMHGEGGTYYKLGNVNGQVTPITKWTDTSDKQQIMGALSVLGAAAGLGGLGPVLGSAMGTSANLGNAALGAGMGALQGGVSGGWEGALKGGLMGGLGGVVSHLNPAGTLGITDPTIQAGLNSALTGGLKSAIGGTDLMAGIGSGALSGAMGQMFGPLGSYAGGALGNMAFGGKETPQSQMQYFQNTQRGVGQRSSTQGPMSPLALLNQARQHVQASGLDQGSKSNVLGGFNRLEDTGRNKFGWTT